ncbi:hypothetical protein DFAR_1170001 [Desulfarculales bacterium]
MERMKPLDWGGACGLGGGDDGGTGLAGCTDWLGSGGGVAGLLFGAEGLMLRLPALLEDLPPPARAQVNSLKVRLSRPKMPKIARKIFSRGMRDMLDSP